MFCNECGGQLKEDQKFCTNCGAKLDQTPQFSQSPAPAAEAPVKTAASLQRLPPNKTAVDEDRRNERPTGESERSDSAFPSIATEYPSKSSGISRAVLWSGIAVLILGCVGIGLLIWRPSPPAPPLTDAQIASAVQAKLATDPNLSTLRVTCYEGIVKLTGSVNSEAEKTKAAGLAAQVSGVHQVNIFGLNVGREPVTTQPSNMSGGTGTVTVPANQPWTDTGIFLHAGDVVTISATGTASMGAGWPPMPPAGRPPDCGGRQGFPAPQVPCWSLIGRLGEDGPVFYVGSGTTFGVPKDGELFLGVNDDQIGDNSGSWTATVAVNGIVVRGAAVMNPNSEICSKQRSEHLQLAVTNINPASGVVTVNGADDRQPGMHPFTWVWRDGTITQGWFPQSHRFVDHNKDYVLELISQEDDGSTDCAQTLIAFQRD